MAIETYQFDPNQDASRAVDHILESYDETSEQAQLYQQQEAQIHQEVARNQRNDRIGYALVYGVLLLFLTVLVIMTVRRIRARNQIREKPDLYESKRKELNKVLLILFTLPLYVAGGVVMYYALAISIDGLFGSGPSDKFSLAFTIGILLLTGVYALLIRLIIKIFPKKF